MIGNHEIKRCQPTDGGCSRTSRKKLKEERRKAAYGDSRLKGAISAQLPFELPSQPEDDAEMLLIGRRFSGDGTAGPAGANLTSR